MSKTPIVQLRKNSILSTLRSMQYLAECTQLVDAMEGMEFHLTTPQHHDQSYEEKRKYNKRKSYQYLGEDCAEKGPHPNYVRSTRRKLSHDM